MAIYLNNDKAERAHTIEEFIDIGKSIKYYDYTTISFKEILDGVPYVIHNVLDDYLPAMQDEAVWVELTPDQRYEYKYNPKKLSYKLYGTTLYYYIILKLNNLCSTHEFSLEKKKIMLLRPETMTRFMTSIYNIEKNAIAKYNSDHKNDVRPSGLRNDRLLGVK